MLLHESRPSALGGAAGPEFLMNSQVKPEDYGLSGKILLTVLSIRATEAGSSVAPSIKSRM